MIPQVVSAQQLKLRVTIVHGLLNKIGRNASRVGKQIVWNDITQEAIDVLVCHCSAVVSLFDDTPSSIC